MHPIAQFIPHSLFRSIQFSTQKFLIFFKNLSDLLSRNVFWYYEEVKNQPRSNLNKGGKCHGISFP